MSSQTELQTTIEDMVQKGKGGLVADESNPTIAKRFKTSNVESTEERRRGRRNLLLGTPGLGDYISGVILLKVYQEHGARLGKYNVEMALPGSAGTPSH